MSYSSAGPNYTPYLEANAILAAQENDREEVRRILREMLPGERERLADACDVLRNQIEYMRGEE
ncbi:hypothetical protein [Nonomuraea sp. SYSU D8015]|uniref:hypothetical protein n=1 Tax=Nonomuraea sp. SYSU D8015 TaxID=2593644 RepID=UPI0016602FCD|nr:hypothetical protein [Nonomuraea sp. SYSU D8015]